MCASFYLPFRFECQKESEIVLDEKKKKKQGGAEKYASTEIWYNKTSNINLGTDFRAIALLINAFHFGSLVKIVSAHRKEMLIKNQRECWFWHHSQQNVLYQNQQMLDFGCQNQPFFSRRHRWYFSFSSILFFWVYDHFFPRWD